MNISDAVISTFMLYMMIDISRRADFRADLLMIDARPAYFHRLSQPICYQIKYQHRILKNVTY